MNVADIKKVDIANGPGVRVSLFVSGCSIHCKGCFNKDAWDFKYGREFTSKDEDDIIELLKPDYINGITVLGGDPFEYVNQKGLLPLIRRIKKELPTKTIWFFSGYTLDKDILGNMCKKYEETKELISYIDVLVDGPFVLEKKNLSLKFRGSSNQRIVDVKKSLETNKIITIDKYMN